MIVLVAGEHHTTTSGEAALGLHCSLEHIAYAYDRLREVFPRDQFVVIASLQETLDWLDRAVETGEPSFESKPNVERSKVRWAERRALVRGKCARLIAEGGAHFDGPSVNAHTVVETLRRVGCDPQTGAVFLAIYSHGWFHSIHADEEAQRRLEASTVCDLCHETHTIPRNHEHSSLSTKEWYAHMPHPCPAEHVDALYSATAHEAHEHFRNLLYWELLFTAYAEIFQATALAVPIVVLHHYCASGGMLKFSRREAYRRHMAVDTWPLFQMAAAGEHEGAITGFLPIFSSVLSKVLQDESQAQCTSLADIFRQACETYHADHPELAEYGEPGALANPCLLCRKFEASTPSSCCSVCAKLVAKASGDEAAELQARMEQSRRHLAESQAGDSDHRTPRLPMNEPQMQCDLHELASERSVRSIFFCDARK